MLLCSVASALPAMAGAADPAPQGYVAPPNPRDFAVPLAVEQSSPAEIEASETAHADVAPAETGALAERSFPDILSGLGGGVLPESVEVLDYRGESAALVDRPGDAGTALLDASLPLRVSEEGEKRPVELGLEAAPAAEEALEPARPLVDVSLPERLDQGIEVAGGEFTVSVAGAADAGPAHPLAGGDAVIYPEVATDTDFLAAPTLTGLEVFAQLRSVDSPQRLTMPLELPPGARLEETAIGGAQITRDEQRAAVLPPLATDADGNEVEVEMSVEGGALALAIPHREQSIRYPVLVDPVYDFFSWNGSLYGIYEPHGADGQIWQAWASPGSPQRFEAPTGVGVYSGLYIHSDPGSYPYGTVANWMYGVPHSTAAGPQSQTTTTAYVSEAWMNDYWHGTDNPPLGGDHDWSPFVHFCLVDVGPFTCITGQGGGNTAYMSFHGAEERWEANSIHLVNVRDAEGRRNQEVERVGFGHASDAYPNPVLGTRRWSHIGSASVAIEDGEAPTVSRSNVMTSGASFPTGWTNSTANARVTVTGQDGGLGVKTMRVGFACDGNGTCAQNPTPWAIPPTQTPPVNDTPGQCQGTKRTGVCPQQATRSHTYSLGSLPEGLVSNFAHATDALNKNSPLQPGKWQVRIDRSAPQVHPPSGTLKDEASNLLTSLDYELTVSATDGSTISDAQMRSGVEKLELLVDGQPITYYDEFLYEDVPLEKTQDCTAFAGSCSMTHTFTVPAFSLPVGTHTIQPVATDALGHRSPLSSQAFQVVVKDDPDDPRLAVSTTQPDQNGNFTLNLTATDPRSAPEHWRSGVINYEVYVDGQLFADDQQSCPGGACSMSETIPMGPQQSPADHEIVVETYDRAGNSDLQLRGRKTTKYENFGYADSFDQYGRTGVERAIAGGSSLIRVAINWCAIAESPSRNPDPNSWAWDAYGRPAYSTTAPYDPVPPDPQGRIMDQVRYFNENNGSSPDLKVLFVLVDSPHWANNDDQGHCEGPLTPMGWAPNDVAAAPPDNDHLPDWSRFVRGVLNRWGPAHDDPSTPQPDGDDDFGVVAIEAWNEPNLDRFWGKDPATAGPFNTQPERFAKLVNRAYEQVVALDLESGDNNPADVKVLPGALTPGQVGRADLTPKQFMERSLLNIQRAAVDRISIHLYANRASSNEDAKERIKDKWDELIEGIPGGTGLGNVPRWITEVGFPSAPGPPLDIPRATEGTQRKRLLRTFFRYSASQFQVNAFVVHRLFDDPRDYDETNNVEEEANLFGTIRKDETDPSDRSDNCHRPVYVDLALQSGVPTPTNPPGCP